MKEHQGHDKSVLWLRKNMTHLFGEPSRISLVFHWILLLPATGYSSSEWPKKSCLWAKKKPFSKVGPLCGCFSYPEKVASDRTSIVLQLSNINVATILPCVLRFFSWDYFRTWPRKDLQSEVSRELLCFWFIKLSHRQKDIKIYLVLNNSRDQTVPENKAVRLETQLSWPLIILFGSVLQQLLGRTQLAHVPGLKSNWVQQQTLKASLGPYTYILYIDGGLPGFRC